MTTFRIDDIGASTKWYNQHGKKTFRYKGIPLFYFPLANFWFFKRLPPFRKWAVYHELTAQEWKPLLTEMKRAAIVPVVAITAAWVERDGTLTPFPEKFPEEAAVLKQAADAGDIVVANHGLTHCIVGEHLPLFWGSNRERHREFYPQFDQAYHDEHIKNSQQILEAYFEQPVEILVPPGNVWSKKTARAMQGTNLKKVICNRYMQDSNEPLDGIEYVDDSNGFFYFHDMELKRYGLPWLKRQIKRFAHE